MLAGRHATRASMTRRRDETMEAWHRAGRRGVAVAQAGVARGAVGLRLMWRTLVGVVPLMRGAR